MSEETLRLLARIRAVVDEQAEDDGLWLRPASIVEDYLQQALRRLHAVIEGERPGSATGEQPTDSAGSAAKGGE